MPRWQLIGCCTLVQVTVLVSTMLLFVAAPLRELSNNREKQATEGLIAENARMHREKILALRAEFDSYGLHPDSDGGSVSGLDEDTRMNLLFEWLSHLANESGGSIRLFERAGQGLNIDGFAQVSLDTNFLQMNALLHALSNSVLPVHITEFSARQVSDSLDKISFSLTISLAVRERSHASICEH